MRLKSFPFVPGDSMPTLAAVGVGAVIREKSLPLPLEEAAGEELMLEEMCQGSPSQGSCVFMCVWWAS